MARISLSGYGQDQLVWLWPGSACLAMARINLFSSLSWNHLRRQSAEHWVLHQQQPRPTHGEGIISVTRQCSKHCVLLQIVAGWECNHGDSRQGTIRNCPLHTDTRGPLHTDTRGPLHTDTRGPLHTDTRGPLHTDTRGPLHTDTSATHYSSSVIILINSY